MKEYYVYVYLNPYKFGEFIYDSYIYKYEPFYVGKGKDYRYKRHFKDYELNNIYNINKSSIINDMISDSYNIEDYIILYENMNELEAINLEIKLIELFGRIDLGTGTLSNMTDGGEGMSGNISPLKGKTYEEIHGVEKAKLLKEEKRKMFLGKKNPMYGVEPKSKGKTYLEYFGEEKSIKIKLKLSEYHTRKIYQYTLFGVFMKEWDSVLDAVGELNICKSSLHNCLSENNISMSAGGFQWKYFKTNTIKSIKSKNIEKYDLNGNLIDSYFTLTEAAKSIDSSVSNLSSKFSGNNECLFKNYKFIKIK